MDEFADKLAVRDSFLRKMAERKTPEEAMRELFGRRKWEWETLE